eukprot:Blabericola_migrator_1__10357@NODE_5832_length_661_cov_3_803030_g3840_i0_p1_GENE_NODE_5832_length_661_cov_3_803030_g3840_i0NODE_5832_length_661_cov_3_803030_g3840_i0_p1_ORF_typecomplete_len102_score12_32EamA/PF00892_20/0_24_NODE_5832_length_661_cov_3_803030_g3840_i0177482
MLIAPMLYGLHALLTKAMLAAATLLNIHAGFTFSAGAIDFALMFFLPSRNVWWLIFPLGAIAGILYFWNGGGKQSGKLYTLSNAAQMVMGQKGAHPLLTSA